jgi:predicted ATPase
MSFEEYLEDLLGKRGKRELLKALAANRAIVISGPSGPTGKTTLAAVLRDRGYVVYEKDLAVHEVCLSEPIKERIPFFWRTVR